MKELFKAKEIHQEISTLDTEIIQLKEILTQVIEKDSMVKFKCRLLKNENKETEIPEKSLRSFVFSMGMDRRSTPRRSWDLEKKLSISEFSVMGGALLKYKMDLRDKLISEFNKLSISLKL